MFMGSKIQCEVMTKKSSAVQREIYFMYRQEVLLVDERIFASGLLYLRTVLLTPHILVDSQVRKAMLSWCLHWADGGAWGG